MKLGSDLCVGAPFELYTRFLNCVDRPSITGLRINNVRRAFSLTFAACLVQEETIKTGLSH